MKNYPRILMIGAAFGLSTLFFFPMWRITILAPQYPDGLTMYIYINKIDGETAATLQNINILNHYIGMKYIEPESIPELVYFPYVVFVMIGLALLFAFLNKRKLFLTWAIVMIVLAVAGIYDFYLWLYDYGNNLSSMAPIKIPGASFQPPVFGTKHILIFIAKSYPHTSGYLAGMAILFSLLAWRLKLKSDKDEKTISPDAYAHNVVTTVM